jgi:hypothetical protein
MLQPVAALFVDDWLMVRNNGAAENLKLSITICAVARSTTVNIQKVPFNRVVGRKWIKGC